MRKQGTVICEMIKRLSYGQNNQVRLYGKVFELISDPVSVGEKLFFVHALERKTDLVKASAYSAECRLHGKGRTACSIRRDSSA